MLEKKSNDESIAFVIFGVTGDLTRRKLIPALYEVLITDRLSSKIKIVGFARREWTDDILKTTIRDSLNEFSRTKPLHENKVEELTGQSHYVCSNFDDMGGYQRLANLLEELDTPNILFYLATPPENYLEIIQNIGESKINHSRKGWTRIVIEKPYGQDLRSAQELDKEVHNVFKENQIYRIDHYLGKETVQNILYFRFANGIFEPLWDRKFVDHIQITVSETNGVGTRAGYYENAGVVRDMFQNHLLQLLALTAMEAPVAFNENSVRDEKVKALRALRPMRGDEVIKNTYRGQYVSGIVNGKKVKGYKDEDGVDLKSTTETFLAARLFVDNWRWAGIPFYVRSGKRLPCRVTEVAIQFKQAPLSLFNWRDIAGDAPNVLVLTIQPNEGITLSFGAKVPGHVNKISPVKMDFNYLEAFGGEPPEAYERLLLDGLLGDATLFTRSDEVLAQWEFTSGLLEAFKEQAVSHLPVYEAGTWGPPGADDFIHRDGHQWRTNLNGAVD